jgi:hypothetical protein
MAPTVLSHFRKTIQTGLNRFNKNGSNQFESFWTKTALNNWSRFNDPKMTLNFFF